MGVKEIQDALKEYQVERDKVKRLEKAIQGILKESKDRRFHLEVSEIVPARQVSGGHSEMVQLPNGMVVEVFSGASSHRGTELSKELGVALDDVETLDVLILILNNRVDAVQRMEKGLGKLGIKF